ncbi:unnamed protein product [Rotaria magnacalcarata]|uniref:Uncharacterized protein n=1 Tax=Rotaria magnacalcarata TaxID=392030 RepID=A0A816ZBZ9_9BILA|nr:unnamed protein product [Rotaria magnacalcarata]CAF4299457.1 unnamed protein product [Rotaria magnacalcarata]CAF5186004.1 unnamed protein product [Rotaria magnacalcarata]
MSKKYSKESLVNAVKRTLDSKSATKHYNVPASTIRRHRREPSLNVRLRRPSYLSNLQECYFVGLLQLLPEFDFQVTCEVALKLAKDYFKSLGISNTPGRKWLFSFVVRHGDGVKWKRQQKLERIREISFTEEMRSNWFALLENVMIKHT